MIREQLVVSLVERSVKLPFIEHAIDFLARDEDRSFAISRHGRDLMRSEMVDKLFEDRRWFNENCLKIVLSLFLKSRAIYF